MEWRRQRGRERGGNAGGTPNKGEEKQENEIRAAFGGGIDNLGGKL